MILGTGSFAAAGGLAVYSQWARKKLFRLPLVLAILALDGQRLLACPACSADPNSPLSKGTAAGVVFLVGIIASVLGAIALVAISWIRRAQALGASAPEGSPVVGSAQATTLGRGPLVLDPASTA